MNKIVCRKNESGEWIYMGDLLPDGETTGFDLKDDDALLDDFPSANSDCELAPTVWMLREDGVIS